MAGSAPNKFLSEHAKRDGQVAKKTRRGTPPPMQGARPACLRRARAALARAARAIGFHRLMAVAAATGFRPRLKLNRLEAKQRSPTISPTFIGCPAIFLKCCHRAVLPVSAAQNSRCQTRGDGRQADMAASAGITPVFTCPMGRGVVRHLQAFPARGAIAVSGVVIKTGLPVHPAIFFASSVFWQHAGAAAYLNPRAR